VKDHHDVKVLAVLLLGFMILLGGTPLPAAAVGPPPWQQHLQCDPGQQQYKGVAYCTAADDASIHVIVVDLHSPGMRLEYVIARGVDKNGRPGECKAISPGGDRCEEAAPIAATPIFIL